MREGYNHQTLNYHSSAIYYYQSRLFYTYLLNSFGNYSIYIYSAVTGSRRKHIGIRCILYTNYVD